jgi:ABC-2 type transport system ATP-binding protein
MTTNITTNEGINEMLAIETVDLSKAYRPPGRLASLAMRSPIKAEVLAVDKVNLKVREGELFGLIGPNGAGKTTLVKMLATLLWPTSGQALIKGLDTRRNEDMVKSNIGFVSGEERSFYWRLTGRQNLRFFASLGNLFGRERERRIQAVLDKLDLAGAADNMVYSYSSGMKQKLSIARGLLIDPAVLFLDEPTKSIDPVIARRVKRFIRDDLVDGEGKTVVLTSHRLEEIEQLCDRFAIIDHGRITFCGTVDELAGTMGRVDELTLEDMFVEHVSKREVV